VVDLHPPATASSPDSIQAAARHLLHGQFLQPRSPSDNPFKLGLQSISLFVEVSDLSQNVRQPRGQRRFVVFGIRPKWCR